MKRDPYNYIKNKTLVEGWERLIRGAVNVGGCIEPRLRSKDRDGYPLFKLNGKQWRANRFSYTVNFGPIPKGFCVCHHCDNPKCVTPRHLWIGTNADNVRDMDNKQRRGSSKLTVDQVLKIRRDYRPLPKGKGRGRGNLLDLCKKYSVGRTSIYNVINKASWKHV